MVNHVLSKLDQKQFGALRGRSTTHALVDMTHMWHQALDQSLSARVLSLTSQRHLTVLITQLSLIS